MLSLLAWSAMALSLLLTALGLAHRWWPALVGAAAGSALFSGLAILSIGAFSFLLTCLQLAAALALRLSHRQSREQAGLCWAVLLLLGTAAWKILVGSRLPQ